MREMRRKRDVSTAASRAVVAVVFFLLGFEVYTIAVVALDGRKMFPENFGNFERVRRALAGQEPPERFSFAVIGDPQGAGTFEQITQELRDEPLSFAVILGDFVQASTKAHHRFFKAEWTDELRLGCPVFVIAGNRDVSPEGPGGDPERMSLADFERTYGPTNFSFEYGGCLFIGLRVLPEPFSTEESSDFLESALGNRRADQRTFVFMHVPPAVSPVFEAKRFDGQQRLIDLFDRFKVDYVITGDYHGYARVRRNDTVYLVTGGGGAHLEAHNPYARFHHAVVLDVSGRSVSERIVAVYHRTDIEDILERYAFTCLYPALKGHPALSVAVNLVILGLLCLVAPRAAGRPRKRGKQTAE